MFESLPPIRLLHASIFLLAAYALISFWILPSLRSKLKIGNSPESLLKQASTYGFWSIIKSLCAVGLVACAAVGLLIACLMAKTGTIEQADISASRTFFASVLDWVNYIRPLWWALAMTMLVVGLAIIAKKLWVKGFEKQISLEVDARMENLKKQVESGELEELPPNEEMRKTMEAILGADEMLRNIDGFPELQDAPQSVKQQIAKELEQKMAELTQLYQYQDISRRIEINNIQLDQIETERERSKGIRGFVSRFFTDPLTADVLGLGSRLLVAAGLILALLSTIGFASGTSRKLANDELARLERADVAFNGLEEAMILAEQPTEEIEDLEFESQALEEQIKAEADSLASDVENLKAEEDDDESLYTIIGNSYRSIAKQQSDLKSDVVDQSQPPRAASLEYEIPNDVESEAFKDDVADLAKREKALTDLEKKQSTLKRENSALGELERKYATSTNIDPREVKSGLDRRKEQLQKQKDSILEKLDQLNSQLSAEESKVRQLKRNSESFGDSELGRKSAEAAKKLDARIQSEKGRISANSRRLSDANFTAAFSKRSQELLEIVNSRDREITELKKAVLEYDQNAVEDQLSKKHLENITAKSRLAAKLNTTKNPELIAKCKAAAATLVDHAIEPSLVKALESKLDAKALNILAKAIPDSVKSQILSRHEKIRGSYSPTNYTNDPTSPKGRLQLYNVAVKQAKDGMPSVRDQMIRVVSEMLAGESDANRTKLFGEIDALPKTAAKNSSASRFVKAILGTTFAEFANVPTFGSTVNDALSKFASKFRVDSTSEAVKASFGTEAIGEVLDRNGLPKTQSDLVSKSALDKTQSHLPTIESEPPTKQKAAKLKEVYDPYLKDLKSRLAKSPQLSDLEPRMRKEFLDRQMAQIAERTTEAFRGFDGHFPGQDPPPTAGGPTFGGPNKPKGSGGGSNSMASRISKPYQTSTRRAPQISRSSFTRSRSFTRLRGFRRVGGVLIGLLPEDKTATLDINGFDWKWNDDNSKIKLRLNFEGKWQESVWHDPQMVDLAMAYAADGRPVTVTMTKALPLQELRICLHPALVDSQTGYFAIELDRFVDKHTSRKEVSNESFRYAEGIKQVYALAHAYRIRAFANLGFEELEYPGRAKQQGELFKRYFKEAKGTVDNFGLSNEGFLKFKEVYLEYDSNQLLTSKNFFFDTSLVKILDKALKNSNSIEALKKSIETSLKQQLLRSIPNHRADWLKSNKNILVRAEEGAIDYSDSIAIKDFLELIPKFQQWLEPPPEFEIWSGVREGKYQLSIENLLQLESERDVSPLYFMRQVAFASEPLVFATLDRDELQQLERFQLIGDEEGVQRLVSLASERAEDKEPWEFPSTKDEIQTVVEQELEKEKNKADSAILREMNEFVFLQRLFRCAFNERFGSEFPVARILQLDEEFEKHVVYESFRTSRFNAGAPGNEVVSFAAQWIFLKPGKDELSQLEESTRKVVETELANLSELLASMSKSIEKLSGDAKTLDDKKWNKVWKKYRKDYETFARNLKGVKDNLEKQREKFDEDGNLNKAIEAINQVVFLIQVRSELEIWRDEEMTVRR